ERIRNPGQEQRADGLEVLLRQRRRAETAGYRAAQRDRVGEGIAPRQLARGLAAEVVIVLVAPGDAAGELFREVGLEAGIDRVAVARVGAGHTGREAAETLRAARPAQVGLRVRTVLARRLVPLLIAELDAHRQRDRIRQAPVQLPAEVEVRDVLRGRPRAGVERGRRVGADAGVERIAGEELEVVVAVVEAQVPVPGLSEHALQAGDHGAVARDVV